MLQGRLRASVCFLCVLLPWINPFASGPSSSIDPWLFSALCAAAVCAIQPAARLSLPLVAAFAGLCAWAFVKSGPAPEVAALAGACVLVLLAASASSAGRHRQEFVRALALGWLLAAAISTAIALCQYFSVGEQLAPWVNLSSSNEAFANLRQRNQFASLTVIGMASLFWLHPGAMRKWIACAAIAWLAVGDAATTSRTGLAQMLMLGVVAWLWPGPRRERMLLWGVGVAAYVAAALALPAALEWATGMPGNRIWERVASVESCSSRTVLWSNVLHLVAQRPWAGWGWGELDYAHFMTPYPGARFCDILDNAHNLPLHLAVELGVPAALLVCAGAAWAVLRARPWNESDPARQMAWAVLAVLAVHSLLEYPLWYGPFQMALGLAVGLLWSHGERASPAGAMGRAVAPVLALCTIACCAYAAWDYRRVSQIYLAPEARSPGYREDPLPAIRKSVLFRNQAKFAELTITSLTHDNAQWVYDNSRELLHYSPEPRVIEKLLESAVVLHREGEIVDVLARYRVAFPDAHEKWAKDFRK
nr:Wzy polymerase domain-containing protein [Caenimonas aquaedulcis]